MVNEKLLRFLLLVVGLCAFAAFGWKLYDFFQNQDTLLRGLDFKRLEKTFGNLNASATGSHLKSYDNYAVLQDLNITGFVPPPPAVDTTQPTGPRPRISAEDIEVPMIQYPNAAWIQARGEQASEDRIPGDFRGLGDRFELSGKEGIKLELTAVRPGEIDITVVDSGEVLTVRGEEFEFDASNYLLEGAASTQAAAEGETTAVAQTPPPVTRLTEAGEFAVGTEDVAALEAMSQEEILAAVPVRPARDPLSNEVRGLRLKRVQAGSVFERLGLRSDDIVLEVNGLPALDRDQLFQELQNLGEDTLVVKVERLGGIRTLTYRLPRR